MMRGKEKLTLKASSLFICLSRRLFNSFRSSGSVSGNLGDDFGVGCNKKLNEILFKSGIKHAKLHQLLHFITRTAEEIVKFSRAA